MNQSLIAVVGTIGLGEKTRIQMRTNKVIRAVLPLALVCMFIPGALGQTPQPPSRAGGPPPGGPGGRGGRGGGPGGMLATQMIAQGDKNADQKLSKEELGALADAWFDKLDTEKAGKLSSQQFSAKFVEPQKCAKGPYDRNGSQ